MRSLPIFALIAVAFVASAQAAPLISEQEETALVEFALGTTRGETYFFGKLGRLLERYGKKLAIIGRIITAVGDALEGLGRWMQHKQTGAYSSGGIRLVLLEAAEELQHTTASSEEELLASKVLAAAMVEVASAPIADDELEAHLMERLGEISTRLVETGKVFGPEDVDQARADEMLMHILEKVVNQL